MDIYREYCGLQETDEAAAIGVVVFAQGSTPQKPGCKAIAGPEGLLAGTLGGGLVEAQAIERVAAVANGAPAELLEIRLDEAYSRKAGPICGGVMRILAFRPDARAVEAYARAIDAEGRGERGALLTQLPSDNGAASGVYWISHDDAEFASQMPDSDLLQVVRGDAPRIVENDLGAQVFVEPVGGAPRLLVVGGGHVGQEVVRQAVLLGFRVHVVDDRPEFVSSTLFPEGVTSEHGDIRSLVGAFPSGPDAYIVLVSKGHRPDAEALEACIHEPLAYLGMIGSERKIRFLRASFLDDGIASEAEFDRVVAPIGADIGAVTVPEIGVSVAAQLVAARRKGQPFAEGLRIPFRTERAAAARNGS